MEDGPGGRAWTFRLMLRARYPKVLVPVPPVVHAPLLGFRGIRRRTLAIATVLVSMLLVISHDLPASASPLTVVSAPLDTQELEIAPKSLALASAAPVAPVRDDFSVTLFTPVQCPVDPSTHISSSYGHRSSPCAGCSTFHGGVDFTPGYGASVFAIADGVVVSKALSSLGSYVVIQHDVDGATIFSVYGHLISGSGLPVGTQVSRGQVIGRSGNTGPTSGPHLHFALMIGNDTIDPLAWMRQHVTQAWGS